MFCDPNARISKEKWMDNDPNALSDRLQKHRSERKWMDSDPNALDIDRSIARRKMDVSAARGWIVDKTWIERLQSIHQRS